MTRHNGRAGKNGVYNPKHNDRSFDVANSEHIDSVRAMKNIYWDCFNGFRDSKKPPGELSSFEEVEREYYLLFYRDSVAAQNERNIQNRHPERNRKTEDLLSDKRTCPEESILQIGNIDDTIDYETLIKICCEFFAAMDEKYGEHLHILDWALHVDESTPHIHERHVFDADDGYGHRKPQQEKALQAMGIELPYPDKKPGKNNNRKMTFDKICRDMFYEICEKYKLFPDREPSYGGRVYREKQDQIIAQQKERLTVLETELSRKTLQLQDVDAIAQEVSEAAYEKACEVVTETVCAETTKANLAEIDRYKNYLIGPKSKISDNAKVIAGRCLDAVRKQIVNAAHKIFGMVFETLQTPEVKKSNTEKIEWAAKESLVSQLRSLRQDDEPRSEVSQNEKKKKDMER